MRKDLKTKLNNDGKGSENTRQVISVEKSAELKRIKKTTRRQIILAVGALMVVVVLIFALTSAWYTNVSKVNSLRFKTEAWGFDVDKINVSGNSISIAPGMSGIIPISIDNSDNAEKVKVFVTVSKTQMDTELQKRIFFYADTTDTVNSETVAKKYLGSTDADYYEYLLLPGEQLILNDDYYSDVPIKWEWVYDMLGFYFRGTVGDEMVIYDEFLRPIEYDLDKAVFDINGDQGTGQLLSVDGIPAENVLYNISSTDGYDGRVDFSAGVSVGTRTYYPVDVDGNGFGVWAYLCSYGEIETGIVYDTNMSGEDIGEIIATLNISTVSLPAKSEKVSTESALRAALADPDTDIIQLTDDISVSNYLSFTGNADMTLDMGGFGITYTGTETSYAMFRSRNGAKLTVLDGEIKGNGNITEAEGSMNTIAFYASCGDVTLSNVKVSGFDNAVYIADINGGNNPDSTVRITDCDLDSKGPTVFIMGNGEVSDAPTKLIISGSTVKSGYVGVCGHGSTNRWGTEIAIVNSKVTGKYAALYQPQQTGTTVITNSEMSGITGIAVKGGTVTVTDSSVIGTGAYTPAAGSGSGWTDTGDGIYVEAVYNWNASVYIKGNTVVTSANAYAVEIFGKENAGIGRVYIYGGEFNAARGAAYWNSIGSFRIYGGTFNSSVSADISRFDL
ncbi:MAG: hypothetical protein IJS94_06145 [Clostridia bacterium]|nr:hypothetical protein [Clostridia bacterium]